MPDLHDPARLEALARCIARRLDLPSLELSSAAKLSGGAIQQNWALDARVSDREQRWVLRCNADAAVETSRSRAEEYAILKLAHAAGVPVAEPLLLCDDAGRDNPIGGPFFVTARLAGTASGPRLVKDDALVPDRDVLARDLGRAMARLHAVRPGHRGSEEVLGPLPASSPALAQIDQLRSQLDRLSHDAQAAASTPALEWGLRECERDAPPDEAVVFAHGDWRTGNYMVDGGRLTGVLDWEFAGWGSAQADVGWLFARCWRFGADTRRCGGVGPAAAFVEAYEDAAGRKLDLDAIEWWETMAHLRWGVIALQQALRHRSGNERSLELLLTGHLLPGLELEVLDRTEAAA